jgi:hypothetical protein
MGAIVAHRDKPILGAISKNRRCGRCQEFQLKSQIDPLPERYCLNPFEYRPQALVGQ